MAEARFQARSLLSHSNPDLRVGSLLSPTLQMGKLRPGEVFFFESPQMMSGGQGPPAGWRLQSPQPPPQERQPGAGCACASLDDQTAGDRQGDRLS